jgi:hypothetical protein
MLVIVKVCVRVYVRMDQMVSPSKETTYMFMIIATYV